MPFKKRTFIAVDIIPNQTMNECLGKLTSQLNEDRINWVYCKQLHLTLKFLGETENDSIPDIIESLKDICNTYKPVSVKINGLGVFKNLSNPTVIWFGIEKNNELEKLKASIDLNLEKFGFEIEKRPFSPHLTIGRVKYIKNVHPLRNIIESYKGQLLSTISVNELIFYESKLNSNGAIYTSISKFTLSK